MKNYFIETSDVKFELIFDSVSEEDYKINNPYNTSIFVNVDSFGFSGQSDWTIDYDDFKEFAYSLNKLYQELKGDLQLTDREYGSLLKIKCEKSGHINFSGKLISQNMQKLEFQFTLDQTYLRLFVEKLYNDFGKDYQVGKKRK